MASMNCVKVSIILVNKVLMVVDNVLDSEHNQLAFPCTVHYVYSRGGTGQDESFTKRHFQVKGFNTTNWPVSKV